MKSMNKLFAALVLFGMSGAAFGYDFTLSNETGKKINVTVKTNKGESKTAAIPAGSQDMFMFAGTACLSGVLVDGVQAPINSSKARCQDIDDFYVSGAAGNYTVRAK
jgi:hypothetical protein